MSNPRKEHEAALEEVPDEEDIDPADAVNRVELDPEEQVNRPEQGRPEQSRPEQEEKT